jgi:hypothetical protein
MQSLGLPQISPECPVFITDHASTICKMAALRQTIATHCYNRAVMVLLRNVSASPSTINQNSRINSLLLYRIASSQPLKVLGELFFSLFNSSCNCSFSVLVRAQWQAQTLDCPHRSYTLVMETQVEMSITGWQCSSGSRRGCHSISV